MDRDQNQRPACAVCNHHRRRCPPNCFIAKYFPHDESVNFADAHKLFGIGNIAKWAKDVELKLQSDDVERAMKNMKTEANIYASDPSGTGCYGVIRRLATQCYYAEEELKATCQSLDLYRPKGFQDFHNLQPNPFSNDRNRNPYNAFENQFPASWPFVNDENRNLYNAVQNQFPASWGRLLLHNRKQFSDS
ncbi:hypothetical protein LWI29_027650 [Acer saccharum]|uniref:LOB domain-containing protein n=1 Tax=Acer saccharum TaxID=4024 RepID=A0AA39RFG5_ACESA|nr:hypothetical protein LWI29_027650 [Acer saccharum]